MIKYIVTVICCSFFISAKGQYPPQAGMPGSTAVYKDSSAFSDWASNCILQRGYKNIAIADSGYTSVGTASSAIGKAGDANFVSLGDGGVAILTFNAPIYNGSGYDFAVFENSFDGFFLELAHVEVSSDGVNYVRFPSTSLTDTITPIGSFGNLDATKINNLAGKYKANYGTPFDLEELAGINGLDINNITHVKIIDVVGSLSPLYTTRDAAGRKINDPYPTLFPSGGFDLDAVGVINSKGVGFNTLKNEAIKVYPTQLQKGGTINISTTIKNNLTAVLVNELGQVCLQINNPNHIQLPETLHSGIYHLILQGVNKNYVFKVSLIN